MRALLLVVLTLATVAGGVVALTSGDEPGRRPAAAMAQANDDVAAARPVPRRPAGRAPRSV